MIPRIAGWVSRARPDGILLTSTHHPHAGAIRYYERLRPLKKLAALIDEQLQQQPGFIIREVGQPEPLHTREGEYAVRVTVHGHENSGAVQHDLGFVFGDDFYALVHGRSTDPGHFTNFTETVRTLTLSDLHILGVRRRRWRYDGPADWHALARGLQTDWYPLDFPRNYASISIYPALPVFGTPQGIVEARLRADQLFGFDLTACSQPNSIVSRYGLSGETFEIQGQKAGKLFFRLFTVLRDASYSYALTLETTSEQPERLVQVYDEVIDSAQPLPHREQQTDIADQLFGHWLA